MKSTLEAVSENHLETCLPDWENSLQSKLPLYGHRNWVVVADSAYPAQCRPGIETIVAPSDQQLVVAKVLGLLRSSGHVRPIVYLDRELEFVDENDAPGVGRYRDWLSVELEGANVSTLSHDEIISKLDQAAQKFCVMVIKTTMNIPYTTVFFELDCGYWDSASESRLRSAMKA